MKWNDVTVDLRYLSPRRDSAWYLLRRHWRSPWRHWVRRMIRRMS